MKQILALTLVVGLSVTPAVAQDEKTDMTEGFSLMEEGAKLLMRGLMAEVEPTISDLRGTFEDLAPTVGEFITVMGPALTELLNQVDDFRNYDTPEFLPNGDIIIRRKPDAPIWVPEGATGEIEL